MNHTVDASCIKTSYVEDTESGVAVLATLATPTLEEPFRSFTIKYAAIKQVSVVRTVVKKRDYVFMEITGIASLSNDGERIGYHLMHSVHFPQTPELDSCVRANLSIATFSQQKLCDDNEVELCVKGVSDPGGSMVRAISSSSMSLALTSTSRNVDCANMKKLMWLVQDAPRVEQWKQHEDAGRLRDVHQDAFAWYHRQLAQVPRLLGVCVLVV